MDPFKKPPELTAVQTDLIERAYQRIAASRRRIMTVVIGGNAGGVVASLSVIGTMLGASADPAIPRAMYWVLVIFTIGLLASAIRIFLEVRMDTVRAVALLEMATDTSRRVLYCDPEPDPPLSRWVVWPYYIAGSVAVGCVLFGSLHGLRLLYSLTA